MPGINTVKKYVKNSIYHIYNRGVEKRQIFMDKTDEIVFCNYLIYSVNRYGIYLIKYVLMPNHFHILVKQDNSRDIEKLMRSFGTKYSSYINYKYQRVGPLFQGRYKARIITSDRELEIIENYLDNQLPE